MTMGSIRIYNYKQRMCVRRPHLGARSQFEQHKTVMLAPAQDRPVTVALIGAGQRGGVSRIPRFAHEEYY